VHLPASVPVQPLSHSIWLASVPLHLRHTVQPPWLLKGAAVPHVERQKPSLQTGQALQEPGLVPVQLVRYLPAPQVVHLVHSPWVTALRRPHWVRHWPAGQVGQALHAPAVR
jgi:hypothetical protein